MTIRVPKWLLAVVLLILVGGAAAVGGYFYGESSVSRADIRREAADKAYKQGYRQGSADADSNTFGELTREFRSGARHALDPLYFDARKSYVIRLGEGYPKKAPVEWITSSLEMEEGKLYEPCGSTDICWVEE